MTTQFRHSCHRSEHIEQYESGKHRKHLLRVGIGEEENECSPCCLVCEMLDLEYCCCTNMLGILIFDPFRFRIYGPAVLVFMAHTPLHRPAMVGIMPPGKLPHVLLPMYPGPRARVSPRIRGQKPDFPFFTRWIQILIQAFLCERVDGGSVGTVFESSSGLSFTSRHHHRNPTNKHHGTQDNSVLVPNGCLANQRASNHHL